MFLGFLMSAIPLALRLYLNIYVYAKDTKTVFNLASLLVICLSSIYFFAGASIALYFFHNQKEFLEGASLLAYVLIILDSIFSLLQVFRVFYYRFGIRVRLYRCLSLAMIWLIFHFGLFLLYALGGVYL